MIITVKVVPGSKQEKIEKLSENNYKVWIMEKAERGKANAQLLKLISNELGVSWQRVKILNPTSKTKKIAVKDVNA